MAAKALRTETRICGSAEGARSDAGGAILNINGSVAVVKGWGCGDDERESESAMAGEWLRQTRSRYSRGLEPAPVTLDSLDCLHHPSTRPTPSSPHLRLAAPLQAALHGVGLTHMNSLSYLSRQFDVLASPRTPPSTPTAESAPLLPEGGERNTRLKRSGSTRSFLVPQPSSPSGGWTLKRSYSSPAEVNPSTQSASTSSSLLGPSISRKSSRPPSRRASLSSSEKASHSRGGSDSPLARHFALVRIILQLWHTLLAAVRCLMRQDVAAAAVHDVAVDDNSDEEEKDTEDESRDEKPPLPAPPSVLLDSQQPPYQPAIPSPLSSHPPPTASPSEKAPSITIPFAVVDSDPRQPSLVSSKPLAPSTLTPPASGRSRSITPTGPAKTTPFHPKTLVLDLDETLIHSTSRPIPSAGGSGLFGFGGRNKGAGYTVEVVLGGRSTLYHVYKRPFVDYFLRKVSAW